ncbi:spore germination protein KA [Paenibacillus sp. DS2015]|uniref:spore germination protein n=1 Tax=Paenibacillus sp. DS2015 TaxID=3373917 RepID=UPI003D19F9BB
MNKSKKSQGLLSNTGVSSKSVLGLPAPPIEKEPLQKELDRNIETAKQIFADCSDMVYRNVQVAQGRDAVIFYIEGIVDSQEIEMYMLRPLIQSYVEDEENGNKEDKEDKEGKDSVLSFDDTCISLLQATRATHWGEIISSIINAGVVLLMDGESEAYLFNVKGGTRRGVEEPQTESVIRGPREGFTETLRVNTALLRFRVKNPKLKMVSFVMGEETKTDVVLTYIDGLIDPKRLRDIKKRLKDIKIDGVLESGYIEELIEDHPYSPFPQVQYTERPDTIAAQLLEGRFAILVDGTPFALIGPVTIWQLMQASEDYYERFFISNFVRFLRYLFLLIAIFLPGLYIAVTTFHQDMLPSTLILSVAAAREAIPFPALIEALMMEIAFEALREAGIRLPKTVGQAVSILGALVIGQAAVEAGIVSAPMVIVVSLTGIASFTIPRFNLAITVRLLRFPLMIMAGCFGLFGMIITTTWILVHLSQLTSFGVPYLTGLSPYSKEDQKDIFVRAPWWKMINRPEGMAKSNRQRMKKDINGVPKPEKSW